MSTVPGAPRTEKQLREALETLADQVQPAPDAYRAARGDWRRRERRRRLVLTILITVVFTLAVLIGLWVLNQTPSGSSAVFNSAAHSPVASAAPTPTWPINP
jgi:ferric-dicitrate binding protein FerR (iron transport regulator)